MVGRDEMMQYCLSPEADLVMISFKLIYLVYVYTEPRLAGLAWLVKTHLAWSADSYVTSYLGNIPSASLSQCTAIWQAIFSYKLQALLSSCYIQISTNSLYVKCVFFNYLFTL